MACLHLWDSSASPGRPPPHLQLRKALVGHPGGTSVATFLHSNREQRPRRKLEKLKLPSFLKHVRLPGVRNWNSPPHPSEFLGGPLFFPEVSLVSEVKEFQVKEINREKAIILANANANTNS